MEKKRPEKREKKNPPVYETKHTETAKKIKKNHQKNTPTKIKNIPKERSSNRRKIKRNKKHAKKVNF